MKRPSLYGLVVCGGRSTRMGMDKSLINYHGQPQRYHLHDLLKSYCEKVLISCNAAQLPEIPISYNPMPDDLTLGDIGPMAALITAFRHHPDAAFLVLGCDYPLLQKEDLEKLITSYKQYNSTVCYINEDKVLEPLLALYTPEMHSILEKNFANGQHSLRRILEQSGVHTLDASNSSALTSIDDPASYEQVKDALKHIINRNN
jgi:molybdenum cofactor guanylyltransferase